MHNNFGRGCTSHASILPRDSERVLYFSLIMTIILFNQTSGTIAKSAQNKKSLVWCRSTRFLDPTFNDVVAIASYPGSGVTWLRYLLQQVTGIATGSMYPDKYFMTHGFPGDDRNDNSVLVVNTHESPAHRKYSRVILLIRDPMEAIVYNFKVQSAEFVTPEEINMTGLIKDPDWNYSFVDTHARNWQDYYLSWLSNMVSPIHVVFYKGLKKKTRDQLENILHFIQYTDYSEADLTCAVELKDQFWHKGGISKYPLDPYTKEMKRVIENVRTNVYQEVRRRFMVTLIEKDARRSMNFTKCKTWRVVRDQTMECLQDVGKGVSNVTMYDEMTVNKR